MPLEVPVDAIEDVAVPLVEGIEGGGPLGPPDPGRRVGTVPAPYRGHVQDVGMGRIGPDAADGLQVQVGPDDGGPPLDVEMDERPAHHVHAVREGLRHPGPGRVRGVADDESAGGDRTGTPRGGGGGGVLARSRRRRRGQGRALGGGHHRQEQRGGGHHQGEALQRHKAATARNGSTHHVMLRTLRMDLVWDSFPAAHSFPCQAIFLWHDDDSTDSFPLVIYPSRLILPIPNPMTLY